MKKRTNIGVVQTSRLLREIGKGNEDWVTYDLSAAAKEFSRTLVRSKYKEGRETAARRFAKEVEVLASKGPNTKVFQCYEDYKKCQAEGDSQVVCAGLLAYCLTRLK